jgi:hypothetical protein
MSADPRKLSEKIVEEFERIFAGEAREHARIVAEKVLHDVAKLVDFFFKTCARLGGKPDAEIRRIPGPEIALMCALPRPVTIEYTVSKREDLLVLGLSIDGEKLNVSFRAVDLPDMVLEGAESRLVIETGEITYRGEIKTDKLMVSISFQPYTLRLRSVLVKKLLV